MFKSSAKVFLPIISVASVAVYFLWDQNVAASAIVVGLLSLVNLLGIAWVVQSLIAKKSIALPITLIILKYPLIAVVLVLLARQPWMRWQGVVLGLFLLAFSLFVGRKLSKNS